MKFRTIASIGLAAGTALALTAAVSPADAASKTTISIHVENAKGAALKNIFVYAEKGEKFVYAGLTNSKGNVTKAAGEETKFSAGTWKFTVGDSDPARNQHRTAYAVKTFSATLTQGKNKDLGDRTLAAGIRISGKVTAPSGRAVKNAEVIAFTKREVGPNAINQAGSDATGAYRFYAMPRNTYYLRAYTGGKAPSTSFAKVVAAKAGASYTGNALTNVQVACQTDFTATSPETNAVTLTVKSNGSDWGLTNPGGVAKIYRDGEKIETVSFASASSWTQTREESAGQHTYEVKYGAGDCYGWTKSTMLTVEDGPL